MRPNKATFGLSFGYFGGSNVKRRREEEEKKKRKKRRKVWNSDFVWIHDFEYGNHVLVWKL